MKKQSNLGCYVDEVYVDYLMYVGDLLLVSATCRVVFVKFFHGGQTWGNLGDSDPFTIFYIFNRGSPSRSGGSNPPGPPANTTMATCIDSRKSIFM